MNDRSSNEDLSTRIAALSPAKRDMLERKLWEQSGHWEKFSENMFVTETPDERIFCCKPMNCPGHIQIFKNGLRSYRELPVKIAEFGKVHRFEPSGALHGLMRVRAFTQDDAHVFVGEGQIAEDEAPGLRAAVAIAIASQAQMIGSPRETAEGIA